MRAKTMETLKTTPKSKRARTGRERDVNIEMQETQSGDAAAATSPAYAHIIIKTISQTGGTGSGPSG